MWGLQSFYFIESKLYLKSRTTSNKYLLERVDFLKKKIASLGHFLYLPLAISRKLSYNSCTEMNFQYELLYLTIALVSGAMCIQRSTFYVVMTLFGEVGGYFPETAMWALYPTPLYFCGNSMLVLTN